MRLIDLNDIILNISPVTQEVFVGVPTKDGLSWKEKKNVTGAFLGCCIGRFLNNPTEIKASNGKRYEISCREITEEQQGGKDD
jgi:hypothetical protein